MAAHRGPGQHSGPVEPAAGSAGGGAPRLQADDAPPGHERSVGIAEIDFRAVIDGMSEGFGLLDADFVLIEVNAEFLRLETRTRDELVGRSHWELYPGTEDGPIGILYRQALRENVRVSLVYLHHWPDGRVSYLDMRAFPVAGRKLAVFFRDVTERHDAEQQLRESEQRFRAATHAAADVLWTNDAEGRMTGDQPGWAALTGQSFEEYQDYGWSRAIHPDDEGPTVTAWKGAVATRSPFVFEHRVRRHDGVWRRFTVRAVPILEDNGTIREWVGVHSDITDLRENELRFRQIADTIDAVFYIHEIDEDRISYVSPAFERIWQRPAAELYADVTAFMAAIHDADRQQVECARERWLAGEATELRYRIVVKGEVRHIHDRAYLIAGSAGEGRRVVGIAEDVTVATHAQAQLARNAKTFEAIVSHNPFGIYVVDDRFRLVRVSQGAQAVFAGIDPLIDRDFAEIIRIVWAEPFANDVIARFRHTLQTGEPYISFNTVELRHNLEQVEAYDWRIERIDLPDGGYGVVCYFYDLSERMALEAELREALADKELLLREIDHRVNNSLSSVSSLLSMQARSTDSPHVQQALTVATARLRAVAGIHKRLYQSKTIGTVEFDEYLTGVCNDLRTALGHGSVALNVTAMPVHLKVNQAVPLGLIANELVTNAFKHCGHEDAQITVELQVMGGNLQLVVADDGIGMPLDYDPAKRRGLGMAVIRQLVRQLGGAIAFPIAGGAARFEIVVPMPPES